jgi:hypothetical protein
LAIRLLLVPIGVGVGIGIGIDSRLCIVVGPHAPCSLITLLSSASPLCGSSKVVGSAHPTRPRVPYSYTLSYSNGPDQGSAHSAQSRITLTKNVQTPGVGSAHPTRPRVPYSYTLSYSNGPDQGSAHSAQSRITLTKNVQTPGVAAQHWRRVGGATHYPPRTVAHVHSEAAHVHAHERTSVGYSN